MNKIFKNKLFLILIIVMLTTAITIGAATIYQANEINYIPSDASWEVNNVSAALDDLYKGYNESSLKSGDIKVDVTRTHIDGSGYADKQTVRVVVYYKDEIIIDQSMTNSSAYNQSGSYTNE